jgi:hypothetical protein
MFGNFLFVVSLWQDEGSWFWRFWVGETYGVDWLWLLGGSLFIAAVGYVIYGSLLRSVVGGNWHPANFRKLMWALCFLLWIIWFEYVFSHVFGGFVLYFLLIIWLVAFIVFLATRRKVGTA